jgi:hypothetical protein
MVIERVIEFLLVVAHKELEKHGAEHAEREEK